MKTIYNPDRKAHISLDEQGKVRHIRHSQEFWESEENIPRVSAESYLNEWSETLQIPKEQLRGLSKKVSFYDPREQGLEYQLDEEKHLFDSTTVGFYQTFLNTPIWRRGLSVKIKQNPNRVVGSTNNSEDNIYGKLPDAESIERYKALFRQAAARKAAMDAGLGEQAGTDETAAVVRNLIGVKAPRAAGKSRRAKVAQAQDETRLLSGKFFIYKYDPGRRYAGSPAPSDRTDIGETQGEEQEIPIPKLPPVPEQINAGQSYLVAEIILTSNLGGFNGLVWLILVEIETDSILYIECMTCAVNGLVFKRDPMVSSGNLTITADQPNAVLDDHDFDETLHDLNAPSGGNQSLRGLYVVVQEEDPPNIAAPVESSGTDFDYPPRTNNFGAVNAYYHQTELFRTIADLGFDVEDYFNNTDFPIPVDHRASAFVANGEEINAFWQPNGTGGTDFLGFCLGDLSDTTNPLCRAVDPYVHWHEMGGHGVLGDHVGSGSLGFAHSHGDGLAAIQNDPESNLRTVSERFRYAPFRPFTTERRFDRDVASGWAWGGAQDPGTGAGSAGYRSEQILATCHFRIYRSIGGDSEDVNRRKFAARVMTYLILRTTGNLTSGTNPSNFDPITMTNVPGRGAQAWCEEMQEADLENWTSEGLSGGAYNKVIRWAFEKQGSYQPATAVPPFTTAGAPPAVDVYIDDGRAGEYQFQAVHWHNQSMWNRNAADGMTGHQNAIDGQTNYMYGKIKNRGTSTANNVTVRAFHTLPGAGLTWPNDFVEMSPLGGRTIASIAPNNTAEATVGPFEWEPNINAYGHDCVLMIASVAGDPSNIDNFTGTETIQEWRLVPNDNNVGQRNVSVIPGGGGSEAFIAALNGAFFMAGNNLNRRAVMELRVEMPPILAARGWQLQFDGLSDNKFTLKAGEKRRIQLSIKKGAEFTRADIAGTTDRMITVSLLANGLLLGGMSYYVDPDLSAPSGGRQPTGKDCDTVAQDLLGCLKVTGNKKVKKVCVKKVSLDIELDNDCDCN